jgi:hypothetical protein
VRRDDGVAEQADAANAMICRGAAASLGQSGGAPGRNKSTWHQPAIGALPGMDKMKEPGFWVAIVLALAPILASGVILLWVQS